MDYNKFINKNGIYLYQTNNFSTNKISLLFDIDFSIKNYLIILLLKKHYLKNNYKYLTENDMQIKQLELFHPETGINSSFEYDRLDLVITMKFLNKDTIKENLYQETIEFFRNLIWEMRFDDEDDFEKNKKNLKSYYEKKFSSSSGEDKRAFDRTVFYNLPRGMINIDNLELIETTVDSISLNDLKEFHDKYISSKYFKRGIVFGNFDNDEFNNIVDILNLQTNKEINNKKVIIDYNDNKIIEDDKSNSSTYYAIFKTDDMPLEVIILIRTILNRFLCKEILREKYQIVYHSECAIYNTLDVGYITAKISDTNKEQCIQAMEEIKKLLKDRDYLEKILPIIKERITDLEQIDEEELSWKTDQIYALICQNIDIKKAYEEAVKYDANKLLEYTNKIDYTGSVYYRGVKNEYISRI